MREPFKAYVEKEIADGMVIIACGLPATNKTETTEVIARIKGYTMLRTDIIRREVLKGEDIFDEKVASDMDKRKLVYDTMFTMADGLASKGEGVILDATFITQSLRRRAAEVAARHGRTLLIQQTSCSQKYSLDKISRRSKDNYESNALTPDAYLNNKKKFEPVDLDDLKRSCPGLSVIHLLVETESDSEDGWYVIGKTVR
ncbi:MAG TPA: AAA family ATPase [Deltaproteobacteria bacterium]|nr:AAA family ATPase [Deltaproteobacteria bacterium]HPR53795.1 AAA family ATPase [Deltaproteobacteria bacterium]HXK46005.1 AAA family ATPase [Deltaproteobacteria bacterium]